jgi:alpha-beta hydrolase superfamily lysophospholipase
MSSSLAPADLARWYNERGFHFYVADIEVGESLRPGKPAPGFFAALEAACQHMRASDGIDAIILSAEDSAAAAAALWCDARRGDGPVDALILSSPDFGRSVRGPLDIACPVLVISARPSGAARPRGAGRAGAISLGQHVTWLHLDQDAERAGPDPLQPEATVTAQRRRLFDEMGRWLGAYMYGQLRDQLL